MRHGEELIPKARGDKLLRWQKFGCLKLRQLVRLDVLDSGCLR